MSTGTSIPRPASDSMDWIEPLLAADTREGVAAALVAIALQAPGCEAASLSWDAGDAARLPAGTRPRDGGDGCVLALPLDGVPAALLLRAKRPETRVLMLGSVDEIEAFLDEKFGRAGARNEVHTR